jgi:4-diphosphocytidyl-2-C-methyl-D-erythritol kinase
MAITSSKASSPSRAWGDTLSLDPGADLSLTLAGPRSEGLTADDGNLVLRAARALAAACPGLRLGRFHLVKRLPVASGIGGRLG